MWDWNRFDALWSNNNGFFNNTSLEVTYRCFSVSFAGKESMERGNKILLPQSTLHALASKNISWPMLFEIKNPRRMKITHGGVLEFISDEGTCNIPYWMMQMLGLNEGDFVTITNVSLPKATWVKLKPLTEDYWDISNPRAVLETALRNYATLTVGDIIPVHYIHTVYNIEIVNLKPAMACSIIETDMEVEFESMPVKSNGSDAKITHDKRILDNNIDKDETLGKRLDGKVPRVSKQKIEKTNPAPWLSRLPRGVRTQCDEFDKLVRSKKIAPVKRK